MQFTVTVGSSLSRVGNKFLNSGYLEHRTSGTLDIRDTSDIVRILDNIDAEKSNDYIAKCDLYLYR